MKIAVRYLSTFLVAALTAGLWGPVWAGEADLLRRLAENQAELAAVNQRLDRLEAQLQNQGLIGLLNQISALKAEVSKLRGTQEEQAHQLAQADKRGKALYEDLDERLKELSEQLSQLAASRPQPPTPAEAIRLQPAHSLGGTALPGGEPTATAEDTRMYESALTHFKAGDYKTSVNALQAFIASHPKSALAANALYWMGLAYGSLGEHAKAAAAYDKLISDHPGSSKVPDALLSLARAHLQLGDPAAARARLDAVVAKYPTSKSAETARKLLATLN